MTAGGRICGCQRGAVSISSRNARNPGRGAVPAKAGTHAKSLFQIDKWIPAFAGMTAVCVATVAVSIFSHAPSRD